MKKTIAALSLLFAAQGAFAADDVFTLKGELKDFGDTVVAMIPNGFEFQRDTILVKNGKFTTTIKVDEPKDIYLVSMSTLHRKDNKQLKIVAVPGETAELKGDAVTDYQISGTKFYQQLGQLNRQLASTQKELDTFTESLSKRLKAGEERSKLMDEYEAKAPMYEKKINDAIFDFIKKHASWEASAVAAVSLGKDQIEEGISYLSNTVKNGRMKNYYQKVVKAYKDEAEAEAKSKAAQATGVVAPNFTLNDINGKPLSLASLKGKYVLLDFWGSWCIWCIRGIPKMKEYYKKYDGKFEILGIDCNDTEAKWKEAVKKYELPWLHVYNPRGGKVLADYGIQGFPTKILIGPDGKIVKTIVGEDESFYKFLDDTFGKK